jgi:hypothetical protein
MDPKVVLLGALGAFTVYFVVMLWTAIARKRAAGVDVAPTPALLATGFVTNFFDTLGIGSMATTTAIVRHFKLLRDELNPGTQNVGHALPVIAQASAMTRLILLALAIAILLARVTFGQAKVVSAPAEPSLLNLTAGWGRASTLGDLRDLRTRSDYLELRVWRGFGPAETQSVVLRRVDGAWSASLARVIRCEIEIPNSAGDTASQATMRRYVAEARRTCGASVVDVRAGMRILTADTVVVQRLDVPQSDIETAWKDAVSAGVVELPSRVKRSGPMDDAIVYVVELRRGDEYRASEIEHVEQPQEKADTQVQQVYAAVRRLLSRREPFGSRRATPRAPRSRTRCRRSRDRRARHQARADLAVCSNDGCSRRSAADSPARRVHGFDGGISSHVLLTPSSGRGLTYPRSLGRSSATARHTHRRKRMEKHMQYSLTLYQTDAQFAPRTDPRRRDAVGGAFMNYVGVLQKAGVLEVRPTPAVPSVCWK